MEKGNSTAMTGFMVDFAIADKVGGTSVKDTFKRAFRGCKENAEKLTGLALALNCKLREHICKKDVKDCARQKELVEAYGRLWFEYDSWCINNLKGEALNYYLDHAE